MNLYSGFTETVQAKQTREEGFWTDEVMEQAEQYKATPRDTEEMKVWIFDLAHGNLRGDEILSGFIKHYALRGLTVDHVVSDIVYHTTYGMPGVKTAKASLLRVLMKAGNIDGIIKKC